MKRVDDRIFEERNIVALVALSRIIEEEEGRSVTLGQVLDRVVGYYLKAAHLPAEFASRPPEHEGADELASSDIE